MAYSIDLKELAMRESEKVEWKENRLGSFVGSY